MTVSGELCMHAVEFTYPFVLLCHSYSCHKAKLEEDTKRTKTMREDIEKRDFGTFTEYM